MFKIERDRDVALLWMDCPDAKLNTLNSAFFSALEQKLSEIEKDSEIRAAVFISKKEDCFIAGADLSELEVLKTQTQAADYSRSLQMIFDRIEKSKKPYVAAIDGACMGGGLELALACHARIACDSKKTKLSLPEVRLGLLPGAGGTQRLPRRIGVHAALDMMLTGKSLSAKKALELGLTDLTVSRPELMQTAVETARALANESFERNPKKVALLGTVELTLAGRVLLFHQVRKKVLKETRGNYPAPLAIIDCVDYGLKNGKTAGSRIESERFGELAVSRAAKSLIALFFGQNALKKNRVGRPSVQTKKIGVIGAGLMGRGIAQVSVPFDGRKGYEVLLKDVSEASLKVAKKKLERDGIKAGVNYQTDWAGFESVDLVIEAVFEDWP